MPQKKTIEFTKKETQKPPETRKSLFEDFGPNTKQNKSEHPGGSSDNTQTTISDTSQNSISEMIQKIYQGVPKNSDEFSFNDTPVVSRQIELDIGTLGQQEIEEQTKPTETTPIEETGEKKKADTGLSDQEKLRTSSSELRSLPEEQHTNLPENKKIVTSAGEIFNNLDTMVDVLVSQASELDRQVRLLVKADLKALKGNTETISDWITSPQDLKTELEDNQNALESMKEHIEDELRKISSVNTSAETADHLRSKIKLTGSDTLKNEFDELVVSHQADSEIKKNLQEQAKLQIAKIKGSIAMISEASQMITDYTRQLEAKPKSSRGMMDILDPYKRVNELLEEEATRNETNWKIFSNTKGTFKHFDNMVNELVSRTSDLDRQVRLQVQADLEAPQENSETISDRIGSAQDLKTELEYKRNALESMKERIDGALREIPNINTSSDVSAKLRSKIESTRDKNSKKELKNKFTETLEKLFISHQANDEIKKNLQEQAGSQIAKINGSIDVISEASQRITEYSRSLEERLAPYKSVMELLKEEDTKNGTNWKIFKEAERILNDLDVMVNVLVSRTDYLDRQVPLQVQADLQAPEGNAETISDRITSTQIEYTLGELTGTKVSIEDELKKIHDANTSTEVSDSLQSMIEAIENPIFQKEFAEHFKTQVSMRKVSNKLETDVLKQAESQRTQIEESIKKISKALQMLTDYSPPT